MALDTTALSAQTDLISNKLITKAIANSATAKKLIETSNYQAGVKTRAAVLKMSAGVTVQSGANCGRNPLDTTVFGEAVIVVAPLKTNENICAKAFYGTYLQAAISKGQHEETISDEIIEQVLAKKIEAVAAVNEKLLWNGDTAANVSTGLQFIDGIRKQAKVGNTALTLVGTDTLSRLQNAYSQANIDVRHDEDFYVFVSEQVYDEYLLNLANKNIFKPTDDMKLFGTTGKLFVAPGLNGSREIYMGKLENIQLGTDGTDDSEKAGLVWSVETQSFYLDFAWAIGVKVIYPEEMSFAVLAA
jgi:hypothetical protein